MRESDGPGIMADNVWDLVWSNRFIFNFEELEFGLSIFNFDECESALHIIHQSVVFVCFDNTDDIHGSNREFDVPSNFVVDFQSSFFVHEDELSFTRTQSKSKSVSKLRR